MNIQFLSPEQAQRALLLNWTATLIAKSMKLNIRIPTALIGDTGCGKTDAVRDFYATLREVAKRQNKDTHLWSVRMSHILPEDLGGYAAKDDTTKKLVHYMLDCLPFDSEDVGVIFFDEFDRAPMDNQNAALPALYGDEFHGHAISNNAYVVLAMNGQADNYTTPLSKAACTRVCSLFVSRNSADGYSSYERWAKKNNIPEVVQHFHKFNGNMIQSTEEYKELAVCTSRTLDMAGMILLAKNKIETEGRIKVDDVYNACIAGVIGQAAASQFLINEDMLKSTRPEEILNDPNNAAIPPYRSMQFLIEACLSFIRAAKDMDKGKYAVNGIIFASRIVNEEWRKALMDGLAEVYPKLITMPEYTRYANRR